MTRKDSPSPSAPRRAWRRPKFQGLDVGDAPLCNPSFPQAQVCAGQGVLQASVRCNQKGIFS